MRQLSKQEAGFLYADTVQVNANVTYVQIYDQSTVPGGTLRFKTILAHLDGRLHRSPVFRNKLLRVPAELDEPYWVEDENFDLEYHVRHIALPKPGDWRQFCIQASRIHARALDLHRPLWEIYVIEGLDSITDLPPGSFALLTKTHHAAIDMQSRNEFFDVLNDTTRRPKKPEPPEPWFPEPAPGAMALLCRAGVHLVREPGRLVAPLRRAVPRLRAFASDVLQPEPALTATRFNAVVSPHRVFDTRRFHRAEFERIRRLVPGAPLLDAVLAVCAGGLRCSLQGHGELPQADLSALVPVGVDLGGVRQDEPGPGDRHDASRGILFGTALADPVQRLAHIREQRLVAAAAAAAAPADPSQRLPQPCCTVTWVPSPSRPVYLHGARMTYVSAILPIADGMGLVFAVTAYDDLIVVSPSSCRELMPDPLAFTQCVRDSFQAFLALAAVDAPRPSSPRASAAGKPSPLVRGAGTAARRPRPATAGRPRSTAPKR